MRLWLSVALMLTLVSVTAPRAQAADSSADPVRDILIHEQSRVLDDGVLVELAGHKDEAVRARAYRALGRLQDPSLLEVLTDGLKDKKEPVRIEAAFALGQLENGEAAPILTEALDKEKSVEVRARLVEALGKCGTEDTVSLLAGLLDSAEPPVAREAATALGVMAYRNIPIEGAAQALNIALCGTDEELRWRAAFAVHRGKLVGTSQGLQSALVSDSPLTLIHAVRAAGAIENRRVLDQVIALIHHSDWRVRVETIRNLARSKSSRAPSQVGLLVDDSNQQVQLTAIDALGDLGSGGGLGRLDGVDFSRDWRLRAAYVKAYAKGSGDGALPELREAMKDPDWRIRRAAAEAFADVRTEQSLVLIEDMLQDESPQVVAALVNSLVVFPQRQAVELIRQAFGNDDLAVLTSVANAAGQRFDLSAVPLLMTAYEPLLSPVDTEVMVAILDALGSILSATEEDDPIGEVTDADRARAEALLESARHDADANVSRSAANALTLVTGETVEPATQPEHVVPPQLDLKLAEALATGAERLRARLDTERGEVVIELAGADAPGTVANFVTLARSGYYDGLTFHRVVADFVVQGGDPRGDGWGGPGYAIRCEINPLRYETGTVGMALAGKDTGGSQFFITHSPQPHLNGHYTIFGRVVKGQDVVDRILVGDVINRIVIEKI